MSDYNGWTNYETWNVKLWMDNEESDYKYWREMTQATWKQARPNTAWNGSTRKESAIANLASVLKAEHEEVMPELKGTFADLLSAAMSEVNWHEIAEALLNDEEKEEIA